MERSYHYRIILKFNLLFLFATTFSNCFSQKAVMPAFSVEEDTRKVKAILKIIDQDISEVSVYADDVVHMAQGSRAVTNKAELAKILRAEAAGGKTMMTHELITVNSYSDLVLTRGRATGTYYPGGGGAAIPFETNNMITFKRMEDGTLKIWQVIFNRINLESISKALNPFNKFFGEWTLKDDNWSHNWGQGMEHIKIANHHTINRELNTNNSMLSVIDGTPPYGHIFWSYNPVKKEVHHLSSFGESRAGVGKGSVNENGDVTLKVSFEF
jgi:ketosteroid isomerase-like protein